MLGIVTGLREEALLAEPLGLVAVGGGTEPGAERAAERLVSRGVTALLSFGVAGGLDPALAAGALVVPARVVAADGQWRAHPPLVAALGGPTASAVWAESRPVASAVEKSALLAASGAVAVDIESGAVARVAARAGLKFAVLRAICDPAQRNLPRAALVATREDGGVAAGPLAAALLARPWEIAGLLLLAREMGAAKRALAARARELRELASDPRF